jgi:radical SAM superfamily enzyme YgiQ (UPF0313 family)
LEGLDRPLIIGITVLTSQAGRAYEIARMIKNIEPDSIVIFGNVHVTTLPREPLELGVADIIVRGEGEETLRELYFALREGNEMNPPKDIKVSDRTFKRSKAPDIDASHLRTDVQEERLENEDVGRVGVEGRAPWLKWSTINQE